MEERTLNNEDKFNQEVEFTDMRVSDVGFGKSEFKTSKPNILKNEAVISEILNISEAAETAIGHTIGPYADSTLIQTLATEDVPVFDTRDGYTILKHMKFTQPIPNAIFKILKEASEYMDREIGDSTSSGIPIQNALLRKYYEIFNDANKGQWKFSPVGIKNITNVCVAEVIKGFNENTKYQVIFPKVNESGKYDKKEDEDFVISWLTKVATISANNDREIGAKIAELYRNKLDGHGTVLAVKSDTEEEYIEDSNAFEVPSGLMDHARMANSPDHFTYEADKPRIAMFDGNLEESDLPGLKTIVQSVTFDLNAPLFIICSQINFKVGQYLRECIEGSYYNVKGEEINSPDSDHNAKPKKIAVGLIIMKNMEILDHDAFEDVALMTGSTPFSTAMTKLKEYAEDREARKHVLDGLLGKCDHITSGWAQTSFHGCDPDVERYDALIKSLNQKAEVIRKHPRKDLDHSYKEVINRLDNLQAKTTIFYCGGRSENTRHSRQLIIEDATKAVAAAIKNGGVSIGGNFEVSHYIHHNFNEIVDNVFETIGKIGNNITAAENISSIRGIIEMILEALCFSFGAGYRYALYNMYRDVDKTMAKWNECLESEIPCIYNIMTNSIEEFSSNPEKCTTLVVPRKTDINLLNIVTETVGKLINIGNMITLVSPNFNLEELQYEQLKSGAAYMAQNSVIRQ